MLQTLPLTPLLGHNLSAERLSVVHETALIPICSPGALDSRVPMGSPSRPAKIQQRRTIITAYSSTPDQTDASPFITASGTFVRDGIVAANWLPMGTYVRLPELYGEKVFVVEDRMHPKNAHKVDVWMPTRQDAKNFGVRRTLVEIF